MSEDTPPPRAASRALVETLRARRARGGAAPSPRGAPPEAPRAFDFATLPHARELAMQRAVGEMMGLASPFFRLCEDRGGATALIEGRERINFASYDYLGLNVHPAVTEAAREAVARYGVSCSASRVVGGERPFHRALERALADLYGVEDAVAMVSGHATNVTAIAALVGAGDLVLCDELAHNSAIIGAQLAGARRIMVPHNDYEALERQLEANRARAGRALIVVEGLYSMDGDAPDLRRLVEIKNAFDAWLMVDEAHALGCLGATGRGIAEAQGVDPRAVEIWMGTLSKTLAAQGGYIAGSAALVELMKTRASGFVFSVGLAAPLAAAAEAAIRVMLAEPERVARLQRNGAHLRDALRRRGLDTGLSQGLSVTPVVLGDSPTTAAAADRAFALGVVAPPIMHPAVPERRARLRLFASAGHTPEQIETGAEAVARAAAEAPQTVRRLFGG